MNALKAPVRNSNDKNSELSFPQLSLKDFTIEETFSKRWGSRISPLEGREICDTTRNVVRSNNTTSSADTNSANDFRWASITSVLGINDCTIDDHALN